jgi:hypothetical protein
MKLKYLETLFLIVGMATLFTACQKEVDLQDITTNPPPGGGTNNNSIIGTWNFVGMVASTKSTLVAGTGVDEEKITTSYGFISKNNKGTVTINASNFTSAAVGYSIDTVVTTVFYLGGDLIDSVDTDFTFTMPLSSGTVPYKAIGNDSLYFSSGFISLDPKASPTATVASGSKITWAGDTLILKTIYANTQDQVVNGVIAKRSDYISQLVKLKK